MGTIKAAADTARSKGKWYGQNWLPQHKRLAIYVRDGFACCYCCKGIEEGIQLTLDHVLPHTSGGTNAETNLVTCCMDCNRKRCNKPVEVFAHIMAKLAEVKPAVILSRIKKQTAKPLDIKSAKAIIEQRGTCFKALQAKKEESTTQNLVL